MSVVGTIARRTFLLGSAAIAGGVAFGAPSQAPPPAMQVPSLDQPEMTYHEKTQLGEDIQNLSEDQVAGLVEIIMQNSTGGVEGNDEEFELDLNEMAPSTLRAVARYVNGCLGK